MVLVVEGTLRVSGRDTLGNPFTLRRIHAGEWWGLWSSLVFQQQRVVPPNPPSFGRSCRSLAKVVDHSSELASWLESHPQREDLYAALRPLLADLARQDRTFLDEIDKLQTCMRAVQLRDPQDLQALSSADPDISC